MHSSSFKWGAAALAAGLLAGSPAALAQLQMVAQQGALSATLQSGSMYVPLNPVPFAQDVRTSTDQPLLLTAKATSLASSAEGQAELAATTTQLRARLYLRAAFSQPADELAKATGQMSATFDVAQRSTVQVTAGSVYGGGNSNVQYALYAVEGATETPVPVSFEGQATLSPGRYILRVQGQAELASWYLRSNQSGAYGVDRTIVLDVSPVIDTAHGPAPDATLGSLPGPFPVATMALPPATGVPSATVYWPNVQGERPYALAVIAPGLLEDRRATSWLAQRLASQGFVIVAHDTRSLFDSTASRNAQSLAVLQKLVDWSAQVGTPLYGRVDASRRAVLGHGAGQPMALARANGPVKAAVALAPATQVKDHSGVTVPTLVVACQSDAFAPPRAHADRIYETVPASVSKALMELKGSSACTNTSAPALQREKVARYVTAWLKRFVDQDTRYSPFLCGAEHEAAISSAVSPQVVTRYKQNCPY